MGFLGSLFSKEKAAERALARHEKKLTNMYVQPAERQYIVQELRDIGTPEAVRVLLKRFNDNAHNATVDIEEKELVYDTLVRMARRADTDVVNQVKSHILATDVKINWPMRVLKDLLPLDEYVTFTIEVLKTCNTEWSHTSEKKHELMLNVIELKLAEPELAEQIIRFLSDENETIRFLSVDAAFVQEPTEALAEALMLRLVEEDSLRISRKLHDKLLERKDMTVAEDRIAEIDAQLTGEVGVHKDGHLYRRRS